MVKQRTAYATVSVLLLVAVLESALHFRSQPHPWLTIAFLTGWAYALSLLRVRLERGSLNLGILAIASGCIHLNPENMVIVGGLFAVGYSFQAQWRSRWLQVVGPLWWAITGSWVHFLIRDSGTAPAIADIAAILSVFAVNWTLTSTVIKLSTNEGTGSIFRRTFTADWFVAFGYIGLAALLIGYLLDDSLKGYLLSSIAYGMAFALTDALSGRRERAILHAELSDADKHLIFSRLVEGVVHNLRNHIWAIQGYLREIDRTALPRSVREDLDIAQSAANDAATSLRNLSTGAAPAVHWSEDAVDLNEVCRHAAAMARVTGREKGVHIRFDEPRVPLLVRGDPLLLREVITNLLLNGIDAAPEGGHVLIRAGSHGVDSVFASIEDDGPGVPPELREHLFEPHFTTKPTGTGVGLFTSYGIIREHGGDLRYEGSRRKGAIFRVVLPSTP